MTHAISRLPRRRFLQTGACGVAFAAAVPNLVLGAPDPQVVAKAINDIERTNALLATARVELRRKGAEPRFRDLEMATARAGKSDLSLRRYAFLAPSDIRGTKLLVHEQARKANDLWLLLPGVGKVRRISASKLANSFAGTDFSYANLMATRLENFSHAILASDGKSVTLESTVLDRSYARKIGYARAITKARAGTFIPFQVDYFDAKGRHIKTQKMSNAAKSPDGKFILKSRHMIVHGKGRETVIQLSKLNFRPKLGTADFKSQSL